MQQNVFVLGQLLAKVLLTKQVVSLIKWCEPIIRTGITCEKIPCYMRDSACKGFIVKKDKYFEVMLNIFEFS